MNKKRNIFIAILLILIVGFAAAAYFSSEDPSDPRYQTQPEKPLSPEEHAKVEMFIQDNISQIAPEKEVLGGTYYVTGIKVVDGAGVVSYEDGHNAYTADFLYYITGDGEVVITAFSNREQ